MVCPASGGEAFDLEEKLQTTAKVSRDSGGNLAWASTFDARGFEDPAFGERTIARLRQSFAERAIGVKIWKNIGMSIKGKSGAFARGDREVVRQFLTRYQDRVLYATDFSYREGEPAAAARSLQVVHDRDWAFFSGGDSMEFDGKPTRGLGLPDLVLRKLFRENALRWLPGI